MNKLGQIAVFGAALTFAAPFALASTLILDSNSSTTNLTAVPSGSGIPLGPAVNLTTGLSPWAGPIGTSTWVGPEAGTSPGGSVFAPVGEYDYSATFMATASGYGSIQVLADDTTSVLLNGFLITPFAPPVADTHCTVGTPNCETIAAYFLPTADFLNGVNTLTFQVQQDFGAQRSATGLDFEATINTTPEPSSLVLLGSGLISAASMALRRRKTA